jgi:hypothetical protein
LNIISNFPQFFSSKISYQFSPIFHKIPISQIKFSPNSKLSGKLQIFTSKKIPTQNQRKIFLIQKANPLNINAFSTLNDNKKKNYKKIKHKKINKEKQKQNNKKKNEIFGKLEEKLYIFCFVNILCLFTYFFFFIHLFSIIIFLIAQHMQNCFWANQKTKHSFLCCYFFLYIFLFIKKNTIKIHCHFFRFLFFFFF